ncbi:MAG: type IV pilus secretin PilQ, partial [Betaproteobacteria bacterium]|nr:type IV pilus secretin PilQ [Betaproteobacteria bacterium]
LTGATSGVQQGAPGTAPVPYPVLSNASSGTMSNTSRILSSRGTVIADPRTNQIFVTDVPAKLEEISNFIHKIDKPVRQVLIEARVVEATDQFGRALGAKLGYWNNNLPGVGNNPGAAVGGNYLGVAQGTGQSLASGATYTDTQFVNMPAQTIANTVLAGVNPGTLAISLFNAGANRFINLELSALEADGKGKVISAPRVITADMQQAHIEQGTEIPYQQATSSGATAVSFAKAVLSLDVTPQITPDGNVIMNVAVHKDSVGQNTSSGPAINTNTVTTQVQVENGGTVVLGGIYSSQESQQTDKVPLLGDIPVLGYLFKTTSRSMQKDELMVFLTPRIVNSADLTR